MFIFFFILLTIFIIFSLNYMLKSIISIIFAISPLFDILLRSESHFSACLDVLQFCIEIWTWQIYIVCFLFLFLFFNVGTEGWSQSHTNAKHMLYDWPPALLWLIKECWNFFGRNLSLLDEFDSFKICFVACSGMIKRNFNIKSDLTLPFWDFFSIYRFLIRTL
jgi:hypothetical protein